MGKLLSAFLIAVFIGMSVYSAGAADINLDGNTSEPLWDDSIFGTLTPTGGDISYIAYRYTIDDSLTRLYMAFQYVDNGGASSSKVVMQLGGKSFTFAANNSISNSGARYMGVLLGATDVMIEAEITANMDSVNSVNIEVFDSKGRSSGTHQIVFQKPTSPEPAEPKPVTTTPVQQNQVGNDQKTQSSTPAQGGGNSSAGDTGKTNTGNTATIAGDTSVVPHSDNSNTSSNKDTATTGDSEDITSDMTPKNYLFPKMILGITISACAMICGIVYKRRRDRKNKTFGN